MTIELSKPRVDLAFRLAGPTAPGDAGYGLFGALCRILGNLHGAEWLSVHPLRGIPRPDGLLALHPSRGELRLRVDPAEIPRVLPLAGRSIEVDRQVLRIGTSRVYGLEPSPRLHARVVVIKGFTEEEPFREAVKRQLEAKGVTARIELGRRRIVTIAGDKVVGFETVLHELSDEASLAVQFTGVGGRQRFGCGVFVPIRVRA